MIPASEKEIRAEAARRKKAAALKKTHPAAYDLMFCEMKGLTPEMLLKLAATETAKQ